MQYWGTDRDNAYLSVVEKRLASVLKNPSRSPFSDCHLQSELEPLFFESKSIKATPLSFNSR